uniref:Protein ZBED8like [Haplochromis burtoni] n=1 Tax=Lepeophtheirus salmonis TaxID=72036 RepID=A0A0K2UTK5_LEPSM
MELGALSSQLLDMMIVLHSLFSFNVSITTLTKTSKKRKLSDEYVQYRFTFMFEQDGIQLPQCMICTARLINSCLAPGNLKEPFLKLNEDKIYKNLLNSK